MKILFDKNTLEKEWYYFYPYERVFNLEFIYVVRQILQDQFSSVAYKTGTKVYADSFYFKFNDKADEAAFLLWSNEGIDV